MVGLRKGVRGHDLGVKGVQVRCRGRENLAFRGGHRERCFQLKAHIWSVQIPSLIVTGYAHCTRARSVISRVLVHQRRKREGSRVQQVRSKSPVIVDPSGGIRMWIFIVLMVLELSKSRVRYISCDANLMQTRPVCNRATDGDTAMMKRKKKLVPVLHQRMGHDSWIRKSAMDQRRRGFDFHRAWADIRMGKLECLVEVVGGLLCALPTRFGSGQLIICEAAFSRVDVWRRMMMFLFPACNREEDVPIAEHEG